MTFSNILFYRHVGVSGSLSSQATHEEMRGCSDVRWSKNKSLASSTLSGLTFDKCLPEEDNARVALCTGGEEVQPKILASRPLPPLPLSYFLL